MKIFIAGIYCLLLTLSASAQETIEKTQKLMDGNKEVYHVLKANQQVKQGMYRVKHKNKVVVSGMYNQNKRTGMWHYFDTKGILLQNYNFDNHQLIMKRLTVFPTSGIYMTTLSNLPTGLPNRYA